MGGQACVFYGAAEFSRDCDIVIVADEANLSRLMSALEELMAKCIAVPPAKWEFLDRGHAIHFRCHHPRRSRQSRRRRPGRRRTRPGGRRPGDRTGGPKFPFPSFA